MPAVCALNLCPEYLEHLAIQKPEGTVKKQVSSILDKLQVRDRTRAVLRAINLGVL